MKKLIRFIKDNPLMKGKIYFISLNFFFIMNLGILHCYQNVFQGLYSLRICSFCEEKKIYSKFSVPYHFLFYFFNNLCKLKLI